MKNKKKKEEEEKRFHTPKHKLTILRYAVRFRCGRCAAGGEASAA